MAHEGCANNKRITEPLKKAVWLNNEFHVSASSIVYQDIKS